MNSKYYEFLRLAFAFLSLWIASSQSQASIVENWFSASTYNSNTAAMDATLGITSYVKDTFESTALIPGLSITLSGSVPTTTWTALPTTFNPNTQGDGFEVNNQWDGTDVVDNGTNNQLFGDPYASMITFNYATGAASFGIALSGFQSTNPVSPLFPITNHELFVNGVDLGTVEALAGANWTPGIVRNAYLRLDATAGSSITSVGFENLSTADEDFLVFDHVAVLGQTSSVPEPSTIWLLLAAGTGMCALRRLQRR